MSIETNYPGLRTAAHMHDKEARELDIAKKALAGDATAKRTLEARELLLKADQATADLRDRAINGDTGAMTTLRNIGAGKAPSAPAASTGSSIPSFVVVDHAVKAAVGREQQRWAKVLRADAARGKEGACIGILTMAENYPAETIIAKLPQVSMDAQFEAESRRKTLDRHGDMWARARRRNADGPVAANSAATANDAPSPVANDPWAKAYAQIEKDRRG